MRCSTFLVKYIPQAGKTSSTKIRSRPPPLSQTDLGELRHGVKIVAAGTVIGR